jgi:hypothetical protein
VGPLCSLCPAGWVAATSVSECQLCDDQTTSVWKSVLVILAILAACLFLYWLILRADSELLEQQAVADEKLRQRKLQEAAEGHRMSRRVPRSRPPP